MAETGRFYVILGQRGPQIVEDNSNSVTAIYGGPAFATRLEAEEWLHALFIVPEPSQSTPLAQQNVYPNSSRYWEEHPAIPTTPAPSDQLPTPPSESIPAFVATQNPINEKILLSTEQKMVLAMVKRGKNVFFTGPAGTGKSVLLREIVNTLRKRYSHPEAIAVTASTGIAAVNIGGQTIHSFSGIRLGKEKEDVLAKRIKNHPFQSARWDNARVLIIDEISMLDGRIFDKIEFIARYVRGNSNPFGGIQLILSGDFFQLPPVPDESHQHKMPSTFAFMARTWDLCVGKPVQLTHVFRQKDKAFVDILSALRVSELSDVQINQLLALSRPLVYKDDIEPSYLFPTRPEVQEYNKVRLEALCKPSVTYQAMDSAGCDVFGKLIPTEKAMKLLDRLIALNEVTVKVGAQVMLIHNVVQGCMVNGSCGKVIGFMTTHEAMEQHIQITEMMKAHPGNFNEPPTTEVQQDPGPSLVSINPSRFTTTQRWPLVRFAGDHRLLCAPVDFTVQGFMGNVEARRVQVPLILSWALSIHKSQGQTLQRVKIDLNRSFERGQAYVAISRATSMEHLEIVNFNPTVVQAHPDVLAWHRDSEWTQTPVPPPVPLQSDPDNDLWDEMNSTDAIVQYHSVSREYF